MPIYQASGMMRKALTVYQTYVEMMNEDIKKVFQVRGQTSIQSSRATRATQACWEKAT